MGTGGKFSRAGEGEVAITSTVEAFALAVTAIFLFL
jgi:hypothetical protein